MIASRNIRVLTLLNFFIDFRFYGAIAIIYFTKVAGSFALGMSVFSIIMLSSAIFELPTGVFSDMIGRRKTVILGSLFITLAVIFYALGQYYFLVIGAIAEGISRSFYSGNNNALLYDSLAQESKTEEYDHYLGRTTAPTQVSAAIAAVAGGLLAAKSFSLVMRLSVIPQLACLLLSFYLIEPQVKDKVATNIYNHLKEAVNKFKQSYKLRMLSVSSILSYGIGESTYQFQVAFYNTLWPVWALGIAKMISNVSAALSFYFSGSVIRKFKALNVLLFSNIYSSIVGLIALVFPSLLSPILMSSTSLTFGASSVASGSLLQKEFTHEQRATMGSLNSFAGSIFFAVFAYFIGKIADNYGPANALILATMLGFSTIWIYLRLFSRDKNIAVESMPECN